MAKKDYIKTIQIAFNINDPDHREMYNHANNHTNVSDYGRRLVWLDMKGQKNGQQKMPPVSTDGDGLLMEGLI